MVGTRVKTSVLAVLVLLLSVGVDVAGTASVRAPIAGAATTSTAPACTFNGATLPIVQNEKAGNTVVIQCTNMGTAHQYLVLEVSLLLAVDPAAAPLLQGQITSYAGLMSLLSSLPEVNPLAETVAISDLSGNLTLDYTLPTSLALDSNATCPPSTAQINAGLIGCGLAMIDLSTFKPVGAASALVQYAGDPFLPPAPTLKLSASTAAPGQKVTVSDASGAKTYWWVATLTALLGLLGGGSAPAPKLTVNVHHGIAAGTSVPNNVTVVPAVYNRPTLTPPKIGGTFTVETRGHGKRTVTVTYTAQLDGLPLSISASAPLLVT